jgi:two-component system LytT family response regulator
MIKALIIEDEQKSRQMVVDMIEKNCVFVQVIGQAKNVKEGVELINLHKPDLVFLDISMPDGTGFDLLEQVQGHKFELIFATASDQHAIRAIKYSACDYLLKPIDVEELKIAVDKVVQKKNAIPNMENLNFLIQQLKKPDDNFQKITLPMTNSYEVVSLKDIVRCEADGGYTTFFLSDKRKLLVSFGLKHYEDLLPESDFIRIHNHHLINMHHVLRFLKEDGGYAVMTDNSKLEISRRKKDAFMEKLNRQ